MNLDHEHIDDQMLGAFVDNQLDQTNSALVLAAMERDPTVRERVYRLRRAKDLMRLAFDDAKSCPRDGIERKPTSWWGATRGLAAGVAVVALGFAAGVLGYQVNKQLGDERLPKVAASVEQPGNVILHISESDPEQFASALNYARRFLDENRESGARVEVVANATGLDMMRVGVSPYEQEIQAMMAKYENVHFVACANAIARLRGLGVDPVIIDDVTTTETVLDHIITRLQEGWRYIKVDPFLEI